MKKEEKNWFPLPKLQMGIAIAVFIILILSINPFTYNTIINGTAIINWLLMEVMFVCLIAMLIDNINSKDEVNDELKNKTNLSNSQKDEGGSL